MRLDPGSLKRSQLQVSATERLIWLEKWTEKSYLLYSSTINCSFTGSWISSRLGKVSIRPL